VSITRLGADYTKAIELDPIDADFYRNRGSAYEELEDHERASADRAKAAELDAQE
jgi:Flp pilus assembly protein TadD